MNVSPGREFFIARGQPVQSGLFGYVFDQDDLVFGSHGLAAFEQASGRLISAGRDGSYVLIRKLDDGTLRIGTDYNGHGKVFLYRHGTDWAISNSFQSLIEGVSKIGWPITFDPVHMGSFFVPKALGAQLLGLQTSVREIRLVPTYARLTIAGSTLCLDESSSTSQAESADYQEALSNFLSVWVSRLICILQSGGQVVCDLSGGLDSRASLALLLSACRLMGYNLKDLYINSNTSHKVDYEIASTLTQRLGLPLNYPANVFGQYRKGSSESYSIWKSAMLGTYSPLFWPVATDGQKVFWIGGEGGESNRRFYGATTPEALLAPCLTAMPDQLASKQLYQDAVLDLHTMSEDCVAANPVVLHYRQFRERFHGARRSSCSQAISPLASLWAKRVADISGEQRMNSGQVLQDIIANTAPALLKEPFDTPKYAFGEEAIDNATKITGWQDHVTTGGHIYGFSEPQDQKERFRTKHCLELLDQDFSASLSSCRNLDFFTPDYIALAQSRISAALSGSNPLNSNEARVVTHVLSAGIIGSLNGIKRL